MMNCKCEICQGNLERGIKSAVKDNGDYYIACPDCGMVYLVHTLENGLTKLERTPEDSDSEEIKEQIKEAYDLFAAAGKDVVSCISKIHNEKENIRDIINDEEDYDDEYDDDDYDDYDDCDDDVDMDNLSYIIIKKNGIILACNTKQELINYIENGLEYLCIYKLNKVNLKKTVTYSLD